MDLNQRKELFGDAYLHAVASAAGCSFVKPYPDVFSVDWTITSPEKFVRWFPSVDVQLKSTSAAAANGGHFRFPLPATALVAGAEAGEHQLRHRAVYLASGPMLLIAVLAGIAADVPAIIPLPLLLTLAGLAVVDLLASALQQITRGPVLLGPLVAFAIALSEISILGFGPFFWALVIGMGISLLLERDGLRMLRSPGSE